ncbi:MAG: ATP-binding protein [Acidobacteria bacterium]|nr:ATP-binding protein [Acidobacteriota bacterium]
MIGNNGSGKTTLVEAVSSLTYGTDEGLTEFPLRRGASSGEISLSERGSSRPSARWSLRPLKRRTLPERRYLFAYGRYRRVFSPDEPESARAVPQPSVILSDLAHYAGTRRTITLDRPDNNLLRDLARYLVALDFGRKSEQRLERIWNRLNSSLPELGSGLSGIQMEEGKFGYVPRVVRNGLPLEFRELSDGYQALLVVIFDLLLRYAYLFPSLADPLEGEAFVAIDEVDLHLHPRWQRTVVSQLKRLFPNTQFLLTTHSPMVVQGAIDDSRMVVILREKEGAVTAHKLGPAAMRKWQGAEVGSVLFGEDLFGLSSRYSTQYAAIEDRIDALRKKVNRGTATEDELRQLSSDLDEMEKLVMEEDRRRADGSTVAQLARLQAAFAKDLLRRISRGKG